MTDLVGDIAMIDMDMAQDLLEKSINREYTGPHNGHASNMESLVRALCSRAVYEMVSLKRISNQIIPLIGSAITSIDENKSPRENRGEREHAKDYLYKKRTSMLEYINEEPVELLIGKAIQKHTVYAEG